MNQKEMARIMQLDQESFSFLNKKDPSDNLEHNYRDEWDFDSYSLEYIKGKARIRVKSKDHTPRPDLTITIESKEIKCSRGEKDKTKEGKRGDSSDKDLQDIDRERLTVRNVNCPMSSECIGILARHRKFSKPSYSLSCVNCFFYKKGKNMGLA